MALCDYSHDYSHVPRASELAADERLASSAAELPVVGHAAADWGRTKQLCVYNSIAAKVQELLLCAVEQGASSKYWIPMPLHLVTSFDQLSTADQQEVRSSIKSVAAEVA
jgi:hypothetical protein